MKSRLIPSEITTSRANEGSALITAVILTFVVSMLTGSYLMLATTEHRTASRSFLMGAGFALAEGGVDRAMHALHHEDSTGWTVNGTTWSRIISDGLNVTSGAHGAVRIVIQNADTKTPTVFSEAAVGAKTMKPVEKQVKVQLSQGTYLNGAGLISNWFKANGNTTRFYQFDSRLGPAGENIGDFNLSDEMRVATANFEDAAIDGGNTKVYGYVSTGGGIPSFKANGGTFSFDAPNKADDSRISFDYYANFEPKEEPGDDFEGTHTTPPPSNVDVESGHYELTGTNIVWSTNPNHQDVTIVGDVVVYVSNGGTIDLKGELTIGPEGSLTIYTNGDVKITGKINNTNTAENLAIYGTSTETGTQEITLNGSGELTAFVYAPNAEFNLTGNGSFYGAVVSDYAFLHGTVEFFFDKALDDVNLGGDGYDVIEWYEMHGSTSQTMRVSLAEYFL